MRRSAHTAVWILLATSGLSFGCVGETDSLDTNTAPLKSFDNGFGSKPPPVIGVAPDPTFPQKNVRIINRTMTPRVLATPSAPAVPGAATFTLQWENTGSPTQVQIWRQAWILGATNTKEFTAGPTTQIASLGALPNGYHTWTDPAPALNTRNCYFIRAGDGVYFTNSMWACGEAPDPEHPHAIGKVQVRLRLSTASTAVTHDNVRVRLHWGIPGSAPSAYTWLDAVRTPFYTSGAEQIFTLRTPGIRDLSDITMIRVEVPGNDSLCLNRLQLIVDDTLAFVKQSSTQQCGNGNAFEWAWHSGLIDGSTVEIPFQELRNSSTWQNFSPYVYPFTVTDQNPDGASFVGYTMEELRRKIDGLTGHNLKEDGTFTGSTQRRFRNGNSDVTSIAWIDERTLEVRQHMRLGDEYGCTVDAHPRFNLKINPYNANHEPFDNTNGPIESTEIATELVHPGIDQGGYCQFIPGIGKLIQVDATNDFSTEFNSAGPTDAGKPPANMRYCFPTTGSAVLWPGFETGLTLCLGANY